MPNERQQRAARAEQMRKEREKSDRKQRNIISLAIVAVVVALVAVGGYAVKSANDANKTSDTLVAPANTNKDFGFDYDAVAAGGKAGTKPVRVVLYEDFQCPVCKSFEQADGAFLDSAVKSGDITIEYRPFAFLDQQSSTRYATRAMNAAMCVLDSSGVATFKKLHGLLYFNQPAEGSAGLPDATLIDYASQAGAAGVDSCVKSEKFAPWVAKAKENVQKDKVTGTPTVRINGKDVRGAGGGVPQVADLQKAIAAAKS